MFKSLALISIENEINGLNSIIQDQKQIIEEKDKEILELQKALKEKEKLNHSLYELLIKKLVKKEK